jgi:hypothetical protein
MPVTMTVEQAFAGALIDEAAAKTAGSAVLGGGSMTRAPARRAATSAIDRGIVALGRG